MKKSRLLLVSLVVLSLVFLGSAQSLAETRSSGIEVIPENETVYANEKGVWRYSLKVFPAREVTVTLDKWVERAHTLDGEYTTIKTFDGKKLKEVGFGNKLYPGKPKTFRGSMSSESPIYFADYTFIGTDENGNTVRGSARIHYVQVKRGHDVGPFE